MSLIKKITSIFSRKKNPEEKIVISNNNNEEFETLLNGIIAEFRRINKNNIGYINNILISKLPEYKRIKNTEKKTRKDLILFLIEKILVEKKRNSNLEYKKMDNINKYKDYIYKSTLELISKSYLEYSDKEAITLLKKYKRLDEKEIISINSWPLKYLFKDIQTSLAKKHLSQELKTFLNQMLTWTNLKLLHRSWDTDLEKIIDSIETILFEASKLEGKILPYLLVEDRLGKVINNQIKELEIENQDIWYSLFHIFKESQGGKPKKEFLYETSKLIDNIGIQKYKKLVNNWLAAIISLKAIKHEIQIENSTHTYTKYEFLNKRNLILLKGMVWSLNKFHDSKTLSLLADLTERSFKKIPGVGPTSALIGNACIYVLANSKGLVGIGHLSRLKLRIRQNNTKKLIGKYIDSAAEKLGISTSEIEEISIPNFDLEKGKKIIKFDNFSLEIQIIGLGKVKQTWIQPEGEIQKTAPSFVKKSIKHNQLLEKIKKEIVNIKKQLTAQRDQIDRFYSNKREWKYSNFMKLYLNHGLVGFLVTKLIWEFKKEDKYITAIYQENKWQTYNGEVLDWINEETSIKLWHPLNSKNEVIFKWREFIETKKIKQPFKQAYREVYLITDAELNTRTYSNRMAAHILKQHQFKALSDIRGWKYSLLGAYDDGREGEICLKQLKAYNLEAQFWINEVQADEAYNDAGIWNYISTDQVRFNDINNNQINLKDVPTIVLSEIFRDIDLFVGVASVGNDPEWVDNGNMPRFRDYWTRYSFGELSQIAKTRKLILENLIPKLKIKDIASIERNFLKIKGKIRTYKIHIGSTNILMEPNDQYLCIVASRSKDKNISNIFLPFEGDQGISLILSKAFLLADDDKITDTTIISQIS